MSGVVGGSERKTVSIISSHCALHIHVFSRQNQVAGKTAKESGGKQVLSSSKTSLYQ